MPARSLSGQAYGLTIGVPSALSIGTLAEIEVAGMGVFAAVDRAAANPLFPVSARSVAVLVGWRWSGRQARTNADLT